MNKLTTICVLISILVLTSSFAGAYSFKFDVDQDGTPEDTARIMLCEEPAAIDIWLTGWDLPDNVIAIDYYFTWETDSMDLVSVTCNNLQPGGQWDDEYRFVDHPGPGSYGLGVVEYGSGVPGPNMKLHTVVMQATTIPTTAVISVSLGGDGGIYDTWGVPYYDADTAVGTVHTVCQDLSIDCTTQNCDECTEICPPSVVPENDYYFWEPMVAGTEKCEGETVSVFRTKTASYEVMQPISGEVCDSGVFTQCLEDYVWFKIQPCYLKCTHGCQNAFCEHLDEEAVCDTYQRKVDGNTYCYNSCLGGSCSYDKECGFEIDEPIYVKDSQGTCAGSVVASYQLRGDCTAVKDIPLPLVTSTHYYDICTESNYPIATFEVEECGVTCSVSVPENFLVVEGVSDSLEVTVTNDSASPTYYDLSLERWSDDGHTIPMEIPDSLDVQEDILVGAHSSETFDITATNPQPDENGETHWDNIIIKAADSCEAAFDYDIRVDSDGDGLYDDEDNCPDTSNSDQFDTRPPGGNNCGDACECEGDLSGDGQVTGADTVLYKADYNRTYYLNEPCALCIGGSNAGEKCLSDAECPDGDCGQNPTNPCMGDLNCDMQVTGADTVLYKQDYNRTPYLNEPCPPCSRNGYPCTYPE